MTIADVYRQRCQEDSDIAAHLPYLYEQVVSRQAQVVVELGTRAGNSTSALLAAVEETGGHLWSVDLGALVYFTEKTWTYIQGDDTDPAVLEALPVPMDVLFIDTSHTYAHTLEELKLYGPWVRPGGVILCHDTEYEMDGEDGYPVARALDVWCADAGLEWVNRPGSYGLGVVEIP